MNDIRRYKRGRTLRVASLFSGIGGLELGLSRSGHQIASFCEKDPAARSVLNARFPGVPIDEDVTQLRSVPANTELLTAGFPCQDLSQVGRTQGIFGSQSGLLWHVFRLIEKQPIPLLLLENVPFMLRLARGRAISTITRRLEEIGYSWAYRTIDAQSFGLPQRRRRVFLVAALDEDPCSVLFADDIGQQSERAKPKSFGFYWTEGNRGIGWAIDAIPALKPGSRLGIPSPPAMMLPQGLVATPHICDAERLQGFPEHFTAPAGEIGRHKDRWRLVGNAINVRVAEWIGRRLANPGPGVVNTSQLSTQPWPAAAFNHGSTRYAAAASEYPICRSFQPLHKFLRFPPKPLSRRATVGIIGRLRLSRLRRAAVLLDGLERHLRTL